MRACGLSWAFVDVTMTQSLIVFDFVGVTLIVSSEVWIKFVYIVFEYYDFKKFNLDLPHHLMSTSRVFAGLERR